MKKLEDYVKNIPDYPQKGIIFRDITPVFQDKDGLKLAVDSMADAVKDLDFDVVAGVEARGFLLGTALAYKLGKGFVMVRKKGKLPRETVSKEYSLEYGTAEIEIHKDSLKKGDRVLLTDDLIATGGTVKAAAELIEELGGTVAAAAFLIELSDLGGRQTLKGYDVKSIIKYGNVTLPSEC